MRRAIIPIIALALLVPVPVADAQIDNPDDSTPTTLYFHIFDVFNKFVINTQAMNSSFFEVGGTNFPSIPSTPIIAEQGWDFNTIYGTSTAGPVEYDFMENGKPRFHPEPGIAQDVLIDGGVQPMATLYFRVPDIRGSEDGAGILPYLTARVTMRTGDDPGSDAVLDEGQIIMQGETTVHVAANNGDVVPAEELAGALLTDRPLATPDDAGVVEIKVPLELSMDRIPRSEAFNIRIDWYQFSDSPLPIAGEDEYAQGNFKLVADPDHLPRLEMNILNPVYIEFIHPQVAAGILLIHTGVNSPWGTYDVDVEAIEVTVDGPSQPVALKQVVAQNQHVHGLHDQAAEVTYLWSFRDEGADNGDYTIRMSVPNMNGTAVATGLAGFTIEGKKAFGIADTGEVVEASVSEDEGSPGLAMLPIAGLLVVAAIVHRRR